jgi:hypothetical protein
MESTFAAMMASTRSFLSIGPLTGISYAVTYRRRTESGKDLSWFLLEAVTECNTLDRDVGARRHEAYC